MSRTLKRPMFRRGGTVNDGIMTGLVDRKQKSLGGLGIDRARTEAEMKMLMDLQNQYAPVPKTRLPVGQFGLNLASGMSLVDSLKDPYSSFVKQDDARRSILNKRKTSALSTSIGQQFAERAAKAKAAGQGMQKEFSNRRNYNELYKSYTNPKLVGNFKKAITQIYPDAMAEYGSTILDNKDQIQKALKAPLLGVVPNKIKGNKVEFEFENMTAGGLYFAPDDKKFYQRVIEDNKNFLIGYDIYTLKQVDKIELQ